MRVPLLFISLAVGALSAHGETLTFSDLKANETIVIGYRSTGCFHALERQYRVKGGEKLSFAAFEISSFSKGEPSYKGETRPIGTRELSNYESFGLDAYLYYLRGFRDNGCTTVDQIAVGFYRDGKKIGEEQFEDGSCCLSQMHWEANRVVGDEERRPENLSLSAYRAIVPPWLIEARITKRPNQSPEPTATSVTPPAAQESRQP